MFLIQDLKFLIIIIIITITTITIIIVLHLKFIQRYYLFFILTIRIFLNFLVHNYHHFKDLNKNLIIIFYFNFIQNCFLLFIQ